MISDDEENPCAFCLYASEAMDPVGHLYYECDLDDDPENHLNARCCVGGDDDF